jgi:HSP20 family protein
MFNRKKKRSFMERITGAVHLDDELLDEEDVEIDKFNQSEDIINEMEEAYEDGLEGELAVDVLNTDDSIIIKAMIAGVRPSDVDIDISRDMVTIRATREDEHEKREDGYFQKELFWGTFSRNILLPEEIDVDLSEAKEKNGLLILNLPKIDKNKKTKLQVKG